MRKLIHCIIDILISAQNPDPSSNDHLSDTELITISERLCRFMMHEFISPKDMYHQDNGCIADNPALCDWVSESQSELHIVK
jgi:hypothetical protein